jgi:hypothetical protein
MDKQQKELILTYFRKRILSGNGGPTNWSQYETSYILNHSNLFDIEKIKFTWVKWLDDLIKHPENFDKYNFQYNDERFAHIDQAEAIKFFPRFIELMDVENFSNYKIRNILIDRPGLISKMPSHKLKELDEYDLQNIFYVHPELARYDVFDFSKVNHPYILSSLLTLFPELGKKIDIKKINSMWSLWFMIKKNIEILRYSDIKDHQFHGDIIDNFFNEPELLLKVLNDPGLRKSIDITKAYEGDYARAIIHAPELIKYIDVNLIPSSGVFQILKSLPDVLPYFDINVLSEYQFTELVINNPRFMDSSYDILRLNSFYIKEILENHPDLITKFNKYKDNINDPLKKLGKTQLEDLIKSKPELEQYLLPYLDNINKTNIWWRG